MLKIRVASALVGVALLVAILCMGKAALGIGLFVVAIIGLHEFYQVLRKNNFRPMVWIGFTCTIALPLLGTYGLKASWDEVIVKLVVPQNIALIIFVFIICQMIHLIFKHKEFGIVDAAVTIMGILYVVFLLSFVVLTKSLVLGDYWVWMIFIGAWATDTFAYFAGRFFGKIKVMPEISPKKTLEGSIGGVLGCIIVSLAFGYIWNPPGIALYHFVILGMSNGIISQWGDWCASAIKRKFNVKDYGNIMPGHGGVLDRFDSILFIAPIVYFYVYYFL